MDPSFSQYEKHLPLKDTLEITGQSARFAMKAVLHFKNANAAWERATKRGLVLAAAALKQLACAIRNSPRDEAMLVHHFIVNMRRIVQLARTTNLRTSALYDLNAFTCALASVAWEVNEGGDFRTAYDDMCLTFDSFNSAKLMQLILYYLFSVDASHAAQLCYEIVKEKDLPIPPQFAKAFSLGVTKPAAITPDALTDVLEQLSTLNSLLPTLDPYEQEAFVTEISSLEARMAELM